MADAGANRPTSGSNNEEQKKSKKPTGMEELLYALP